MFEISHIMIWVKYWFLLFHSTEHRGKLCFIPGRKKSIETVIQNATKPFFEISAEEKLIGNSIITLNYGTVNGHFEFPYCMQ